MKTIARLWFCVILTVVAQTCLYSNYCYGDSPAEPRNYSVLTQNEKYVFRMVAGGYYVRPLLLPPGEKSTRERKYIPPEYPSSGMYLNDRSKTPLWTVKWYSFEVIPFSDGKHVVRFGPWASEYTQLALAFCEQGKEIARYRIDELVKKPGLLPKTVSHFFWKAGVVYDDEKGLLYLGTLNEELCSFDICTGKCTEQQHDTIGNQYEDAERAIMIAVLNGMTVRVKDLRNTKTEALSATCSMQDIRNLAKQSNLQILYGNCMRGSLPIRTVIYLDKLANANHIDFSSRAVFEDEIKKIQQSMISHGVDPRDPCQ